MSTWHAYADRDGLISGAGVLVTGGHETVRVRAGDRVSIEMPDRNRLSAVVVERTEARLLMAIGDGPFIRLRPAENAEAFADFQLSDGFSRECWTVQ